MTLLLQEFWEGWLREFFSQAGDVAMSNSSVREEEDLDDIIFEIAANTEVMVKESAVHEDKISLLQQQHQQFINSSRRTSTSASRIELTTAAAVQCRFHQQQHQLQEQLHQFH